MVGIALYWAEGAKQKPHNVSQQVCFGNSDPHMVQLFLRWLSLIEVPQEDRIYSIYIHKTGDIEKAICFWASVIKENPSVFDGKICYKKGNPKTKRKNVGEDYTGLLRVTVKKSTDLNRKIPGWVQGLTNCN